MIIGLAGSWILLVKSLEFGLLVILLEFVTENVMYEMFLKEIFRFGWTKVDVFLYVSLAGSWMVLVISLEFGLLVIILEFLRKTVMYQMLWKEI